MRRVVSVTIYKEPATIVVQVITTTLECITICTYVNDKHITGTFQCSSHFLVADPSIRQLSISVTTTEQPTVSALCQRPFVINILFAGYFIGFGNRGANESESSTVIFRLYQGLHKIVSITIINYQILFPVLNITRTRHPCIGALGLYGVGIGNGKLNGSRVHTVSRGYGRCSGFVQRNSAVVNGGNGFFAATPSYSSGEVLRGQREFCVLCFINTAGAYRFAIYHYRGYVRNGSKGYGCGTFNNITI